MPDVLYFEVVMHLILQCKISLNLMPAKHQDPAGFIYLFVYLFICLFIYLFV